jgi:hypothetical protein
MTTETRNVKYLDPWIIDAVNFIERHHSVAGQVPRDDDIMEYLKLTKKHQGINSESISTLKSNAMFLASMESRGIVINVNKDGDLREVNGLTPRQTAAASVMMNLIDRRSDEKKLRDIGVSTEEFSNWMQNTEFSNYMAQRSELMITNMTHEAHLGLARGVRQGNPSSIKLYYEMTGRYNPNEENNVNIRVLIGRVLEAIQMEVKEPETLNKLAIRLSQITLESGTSPVGNALPFVPGNATRKEL